MRKYNSVCRGPLVREMRGTRSKALLQSCRPRRRAEAPAAPRWSLGQTPGVPPAGPSPGTLSRFSWEAFRVPAPRAHGAFSGTSLPCCYFTLPSQKASKSIFFFLTYIFLKNFSHYSKEYLNGHSKPRCLMTADLLKKGGEGGFALGGGRK